MVPRSEIDGSERSAIAAALDGRSPLSGTAATLAVWGAFHGLVVVPSSLSRFERNAVFLACVLAVLAAVVAIVLADADRVFVTVFLAAPFAVVALSLPPVVALLQWGQYPAIPVSRLPHVVGAIERRVLAPFGLGFRFATTYDREGVGYMLCWLVYSVPIGWLLGSATLQLRFLAGEDLSLSRRR